MKAQAHPRGPGGAYLIVRASKEVVDGRRVLRIYLGGHVVVFIPRGGHEGEVYVDGLPIEASQGVLRVLRGIMSSAPSNYVGAFTAYVPRWFPEAIGR